MTGRLIGIAARQGRRAPMQVSQQGEITVAAGLAGDSKGARYPRRQITVLAIEAWRDALAGLEDLFGVVDLPWTARRANLLTQGLDLRLGKGSRLTVGAVLLEVTGTTYPCVRMEEVQPGLLKALARDQRGGITCRVIEGGVISVGDAVAIRDRKVDHRPRLPA